MPEQTLTCPHCGGTIELTEALEAQIRESMRDEFNAEAKKRDAALQKKTDALAAREQELAEKEKTVNEAVESKLKMERQRIRDEMHKKAIEEFGEKNKSLQEELDEKRRKLDEANRKELEHLKKQRELEERQKNLELEIERKLNQERKQIQEKAAEQALEQQRLKMREKDDLIGGLQQQVQNLQRRIEQGSQERQGEAAEEELAALLRSAFPLDDVEDVPKGIRGADLIQKVKNPSGKVCGTILWESKNTREYSNDWIPKLKQDQQTCAADVAVLMTVAMPKNVKHFDLMDDVWVTNYASGFGLCTALRQNLIQLDRHKLVARHQDGMKDVIYNYITGQEFARRVKAVVSAYKTMQEELETEKRSMKRIWKRREKQIDTVLNNMTEMYGEIEGLLGGHKVLPNVETLSLDMIAGDEEDDSDD